MPYAEQTWNETPGNANAQVTAARLNYMEAGIAAAQLAAESVAGSYIQKKVHLDSFSGASDDLKLTAFFTAWAGHANPPTLMLTGRNFTFATTRTPFNGLRIEGDTQGPKNLELSGPPVPAKVTLNCGTGSSSWFNGTGTYYDIYIGNIAFQYQSGASFWYQPTGTLYACQFHSLTHYGCRNVFGNGATKALLTQTIFSGHWTVLGNTHIPFLLGGSDNNLWTEGYCNLQGSGTTAGAGQFLFIADSLQKTNVANLYLTAVNGWRGIKAMGTSGAHGLHFTGCRTEGAGTGNQLAGNAVRITGGGVTLRDHWCAYAMSSPSSENGVIEVTGGNVLIDRLTYTRGVTATSVPLVYVSGGSAEIRSCDSSTSESIALEAAGGTIKRPDLTSSTSTTLTV